MNSSIPTILVTGGTGLLGSHLIAQLLNKGNQIKALSRNEYNRDIVFNIYQKLFPGEAFPCQNIHWVKGELSDYALLLEIMNGIDLVYHCAALVSFNPKLEAGLLQINVRGTANMVNAALENGVAKFCHVSSTAALGKEDVEGFIDEQSIRNHADSYSVYSLSKFYAETEVWRGIEEGLKAVIINPSVIIGPGNWNQSSMRLFKTVDNGMPFYTNGITGYVDVRDVVSIMMELMNRDIFSERFCISAHNLSVQQVFTEIAIRINKKPPSIEAKPWMIALAYRWGKLVFSFGGKEPGLTKDSAKSAFTKHYYSSEKIKKLLDYQFYSVDEMFNYALCSSESHQG